MTALQTLSVVAQGVRTRVLQGGDPHAPEAAVFIHGNPGCAQDWELLMQGLAPHCRVIAPDMPGYGQADKPSTYPYSVQAGAEFIGELVASLGVSRAHLVLHDFGGAWGLVWASHHPQAFASATLINTGVLRGYRWHMLARIWRTPWLGELQLRVMTRSSFRWAIRLGCPRGLPLDFINRMYDDLDSGTRQAILKLYRATDHPGGALARQLTQALRPLDRPTLVIWGAADPYLPLHLAEQQREVFPRADVLVLPRSGHFPFADDPLTVESAVVPFIREHLAEP